MYHFILIQAIGKITFSNVVIYFEFLIKIKINTIFKIILITWMNNKLIINCLKNFEFNLIHSYHNQKGYDMKWIRGKIAADYNNLFTLDPEVHVYWYLRLQNTTLKHQYILTILKDVFQRYQEFYAQQINLKN